MQLIERRLEQLHAMILLYKGKPSLENWLASEIIDWQIKRNDYLHNHSTPGLKKPLIPAPSSIQQLPQLPLPTSVSNPPANPDTMLGNLTERPRQPANSRAYWQPGQPVGAPAQYFR